MIGIIAAMKVEIDALKQLLSAAQTERISGMEFVRGCLCGREVVCVQCGIGKVNAAVCTQTLILKYSPELVINTGVGGALDPSLKICEVVVGEYAVQHDVDTSALGDEPGMVSTVNIIKFPLDNLNALKLMDVLKNEGIAARRGGIATGDAFVDSKNTKQRIAEQFGCAVCDMEGAAIAHACYLNSVPCEIVRAVSDGADEGAKLSYTEFAALAAQNSIKAVKGFIENY